MWSLPLPDHREGVHNVHNIGAGDYRGGEGGRGEGREGEGRVGRERGG